MPLTEEELDFLRAFESCKLPADQWTHNAHVRFAWLCLEEAGLDVALQRIRNGILRYNEEVLDKLSEYHETVTVAFTTLVFSRKQDAESWPDFAVRNQDLFARSPPALAVYYSKVRLKSPQARREFVAPDLRPLPVPR